MGFTQAQLQQFRDHTIEDILPDPLRLLFVGINPGLWTAAVNTPFARPGNRFWPALRRAGVIDRDVSPATGLTADDREYLARIGLGFTNLVARATARADELDRQEFRDGGTRLRTLVAERRPPVVAVAGITAYRTAFGRPRATTGEQPEPLAGSRLFVVPNPSGLNAHDTVDTLADAYRAVARAAGLVAD